MPFLLVVLENNARNFVVIPLQIHHCIVAKCNKENPTCCHYENINILQKESLRDKNCAILAKKL